MNKYQVSVKIYHRDVSNNTEDILLSPGDTDQQILCIHTTVYGQMCERSKGTKCFISFSI
jgi:hypothetical protein